LEIVASGGFYLQAPVNYAEAGGPAFAGPSAAWMPPQSLQGRRGALAQHCFARC
jgi:hypothetical protein